MKANKRVKAALLLCAALALVLTGCATKQSEPVPELLKPIGAKTDTAEVVRGELYTTTMYEGSVEARTEELSFEINGTIGTMNVYLGKWVEEGDILMELDQTARKEQMENLQAQIDYIEANGEYDDAIANVGIDFLKVDMEELIANGRSQWRRDLKQLEIDEAEMALQQAQELRALSVEELQAQLDVLNEDLGRNTIVAPCSGHVYYDPGLRVGSTVLAQKAVLYITDPNDLRFTIPNYVGEMELASSRYYALIGGQRCEVEYIPLEREEMSSILLSGSRLPTHFRVTGPEEALEKISAGESGAFCMEKGYIADALLIPVGALHNSSGELYVYVITDEGQEKRVVSIGGRNGIVVQILDGLEEGELVYVRE